MHQVSKERPALPAPRLRSRIAVSGNGASFVWQTYDLPNYTEIDPKRRKASA
jgi:hypothetical protein